MKNALFDASSIVYHENKNIDRVKWNTCINSAPNGLIYGLSFYLDTMAKHWDALVMNDYEAIMPVTWNKKYGIYYLYQPFLCACLGIFGKDITAETVSAFLSKIPGRFKYWDIYLNAANNFPLEKYASYTRANYALGLNKPYAALLGNFRSSYKQLIKKSTTNNLEVKRNIDATEIINLAKIKLEPVANIKKKDWQNFVELYSMLAAKSMAVNYGVYLKNDLLASGIFLFSNNKAYYILAGNSDKGRSFSASHLVINTFIQHYAGTSLILDFEGSSIPEIAFFFKGFGANRENYTGIKYNALPPLLRRLKK